MSTRRLHFVFAAACALGACTDASETSVLLDVTYRAELDPEEFRMTANGVSQLGAPARTVRVVFPDEWAGSSIDIVLDAMSEGESIARGRTALTPIAGDEVRGSIMLDTFRCGALCDPGATRCEGDGVAICELGPDDCTYWQEPIECSTSTPYCSNGRCSDQCEDECTVGAARCSGNAVQTCGEGDNDTCRDWTDTTSCGAGESCSDGTCEDTATGECTSGATRCSGDGYQLCLDTSWSPTISCGVGETCGANDMGIQGCVPSTGTGEEIAATGDVSCLRKVDGTVQCWGRNINNTLAAPSGAFVQISAATHFSSVGANHTCARRADGTAACWGNNQWGESVVPSGTYSHVSGGGNHTCAIRTNGTIACWGNSSENKLVAPAGTFTTVEAGGSHACALNSSGAAVCWGSNSDNQSVAPTGVTFASLDAGNDFTCGIKTDGSLLCWGDMTSTSTSTFTKVAAGGHHACGISASTGMLSCWGSNNKGQANQPTGTFISVAAGYEHSCAVRTDRTVVCWGANTYGQASVP